MAKTRLVSRLLAVSLLSVAVVGCAHKPDATPSTGGPKNADLSSKDPTKSPGVPPVVDLGPVKSPDFKDATHTMTENGPWFLMAPTQQSKPDGILAAGSQVLVLIPGETYSKVKIGSGNEVYVGTAMLKPMGK